METRRPVPDGPMLVRRASPADERDVAALLRDIPVGPAEIADLIRRRAVLVLSDVTLPPPAPLAAAAVFRLDWPARAADVAGLGVHRALRRRGHGRRLLTRALLLLRAEGFECVQAWAEPGGAGASLLASAGFSAEGDAARAGSLSRFLLRL